MNRTERLFVLCLLLVFAAAVAAALSGCAHGSDRDGMPALGNVIVPYGQPVVAVPCEDPDGCVYVFEMEPPPSFISPDDVPPEVPHA